MRIKTHQKKNTFVTLISEENETRNKNPAIFFTLQNFLAGAPQPWPKALRLWARCQHPNQKPAPSSAQGSEALGQVLAPKPKINVYGIAWLSIASYSVLWYDII